MPESIAADEERKQVMLRLQALVDEDPERGWDKAWYAILAIDFRPFN